MNETYPMDAPQHRRPLGRALLLAVGLALGASGCIFGTDKEYLAGDLEPLQLAGADPVNDASGIGRAAPLTLRFTHRVLPDSVGEDTIRLLAGSTEVTAATHVDLLDCTLSVTPTTPFDASIDVTLEVEGIQGFGTRPLDEPVTQSYRTGTALGMPSPRPSPTFAEVYARIIAPRCAGCHKAHRPPFGLDMSNMEVARDRLLNGVSQQDDAIPYVVPGHHAASYVMQKILGLPGVTGDPMPRAGEWPIDRHCQTLDPDLRLLADWIDEMAP